MNKTIFPRALTLAAVFALAGCNKAGKLNQPSESARPPTGPVELKQKWPAGERVVRDIDMKMTSEISPPGQTNSIKQDTMLGQKYGLTVLKETPDGGRQVEVEFLEMRIKLDQSGKTIIDYDSTKKAADAGKNPIGDQLQKTFQNLIGLKLEYYLDASNEVTRIEGIDELKKRLAAGGPTAAGLGSMFNEGYLKQLVESTRFLPARPVQPGDTWPVQQEIPMGEQFGTIDVNYNVTFQNWERRGKRLCARLEFDGTFKTKTEPNSKAGAMTMTIQNGDASGIAWFDPELGIVIDSNMDQDLAMAITVPVRVRGRQTLQTVKTSMHQAIRVKLDSVN